MITPASEQAVAADALSVHKSLPSDASAAFPVPGVFHRWYWALVPLLAVAAYVTVLRIGFLSDDYALLITGSTQGLDAPTLLPQPPPYWSFYRPVGVLFTWVLGWHLWGFNPLPYHMTGLLLHAAASLMLGLWLSAATNRPTLGWLAGALFAVFPLHTEAVGWLSAQWDALSALLAISALYCFTLWWRHGQGRLLYPLALLFYALGLFTKESLLAWLPIFAVVAWFVTPRFEATSRRRLAYALLPFCAVFAVNVGLRLLTWGDLGGYRGISYDYMAHGWDWLNAHLRFLLSPVNPAVLGDATAQIVGLLTSVALLLGLILYGRKLWRLLLLAASWILLALLPALNLPPNPQDMEQNRLLYLASAGYCVGTAALLYTVLTSAHRWRRPALVLTALVLLLGIIVSWAQLRPWHTATVQVESLEQELHRLIPTQQASADGSVWYLENVPDNYEGAYLLRIGLGALRYFAEGDKVQVKTAQSIAAAPLTQTSRDAFAINFSYDQADSHWHVINSIGITSAGRPLALSQTDDTSLSWDFTSCASGVLASWQPQHAKATCKPGEGLLLDPIGDDPYLTDPDILLDTAQPKWQHLRLRASVRYPSTPQPNPLLSEWFWKSATTGWNPKDSTSTPIKQDGQPHTYWTILSHNSLQQPVTGLRFDPINAKVQTTIQWIDLDLVQ